VSNPKHDAQFDQVGYFRNLNNLAIDLKKTAGKDRSADIDAMFNLVAQGKMAAETMPDVEKHALLKKIQQITNVSSATLGLDGPATNTATKKNVDTEGPGPGIEIRGEKDNLTQQNYHDGTVRKAEPRKSGIVDRRELEFNATALLAVIVSSAGEQARRPTNIEFGDDHIVVMRGPNHSMTLTDEQIGGLLIQYCIKVKIPIPRESGKSVRITPNSVILLFTRELPEMPMQGMSWSQNDRLK
jgi:hypothetical protein